MSEEIATAAGDRACAQRQAAADAAARNIAQARQIVTAASQMAWSLYASGDLSDDQHSPIALALGVADMGIKAVEELAAERTELESQLGAAHEEIALLTAALRQAARMKTIAGARRIVEDAIGKERE